MRPLVVVVLVLAASPARAQDPDPVRGYVIDLRGATTGLPKDTAFFPPIPLDTVVPARGFGFDVGAHVYLFPLGPSRIGAGATFVRTRGTAPGIVANARMLAPQLSFNFGTADGWSYLSVGLGRAWVDTEVQRETERLTEDARARTALNYGGGARWFLTRRAGVGFDLRFHHLSGAPNTTLFSASVGFSVR